MRSIKLIAYYSDIQYVKANAIPHVDALLSLQFNNDFKDKKMKNPDEEMLDWVETDILALQGLVSETRHEPLLSKISEKIKRNLKDLTKK